MAQQVIVPHLPIDVSSATDARDHLEKCWWYHPMATRNALNHLLAGQPVGAFAVRKSTRYEGCFVLIASINAQERMVYEWLIVKHSSGGYHLQNSNLLFRNVIDVISFLCTSQGGAILGLVLRPDIYPKAGEVVRPVMVPSSKTTIETKDIYDERLAMPAQAEPEIIEEVHTQLVFDIVAVEDDESFEDSREDSRVARLLEKPVIHHDDVAARHQRKHRQYGGTASNKAARKVYTTTTTTTSSSHRNVK